MKNKFLIFSTLLAGVMLLLALFPKQTFAQCLQYPVELSERIGDAALIVEGSVLDVKTLRDASDERIYTFYLVEPSKLLKGNSSDHFWIEVPGGQLGMEIQRYSPEFKIQINEAGVYMVNPTATHLDGLLVYKSVAHAQGAIRYHTENGKALGEFDAYESPDALLKAVSENTG